MRIVITGSIAYDYLMRFPGRFRDHLIPDKLDRISVSFLVESLTRQRGGVGANIAYSLALLGERPILMGTVGADFGEYRTWLEEAGVDVSAVREIPNEFTASFFANTDIENNQIGSFYTGAMAYARELSFYDLPGPVDLTIISPNDPLAMQKYPAECKALGIPYIYDPSQQVVRLDGAALRAGVEGADILIVNDYEYELLKERTAMSEAEIRAAVKRAVIVTRGEKGSLIWAAGEEISVPVVPPRQVLDPTGVGDAYRAGIIKGLALHLPWRICGQIGALAAAYVLETHGPQAHSYTPTAFGERYKAVFGEDAFTGIIEG